MRAIAVGLAAALGFYFLNIIPGALAFFLGLGAATLTGFVGAGFDPQQFIQNTGLQVNEVFRQVLPAGTELKLPIPAAMSRPKTVQDVQRNLRAAGLENCSLIVGIDFTKSNMEQGYATYHGRSNLHSLEWAKEGKLNPYQTVLSIIGETLAGLDDDGVIPAYYFGDTTTRDHSVKPLAATPPKGFEELSKQYTDAIAEVKMDGPTSFGPLIDRACEIVHESGYEFHILLIVTDGAVNDRNNETMKAIVKAAADYPLAIIAVGVGDGPWTEMTTFDDELPERRFDNFTFVNYEQIRRKYDSSDVVFAEEALRETPAQYKFARAKGLLGQRRTAPSHRRR
jgi:E3 ubiquitin-protein ligase RGLG